MHLKALQGITYSAGKYTQHHICNNGNVLRSFFRIWKFVGAVVSNDLVGAGTGGDVLHASNSNKSGSMAGWGIRASAPMVSMHNLMHDRTIGGTIGKAFGKISGARPSLGPRLENIENQARAVDKAKLLRPSCFPTNRHYRPLKKELLSELTQIYSNI